MSRLLTTTVFLGLLLAVPAGASAQDRASRDTGVTGAFTLSFDEPATLWGGSLTAHVGLRRHLGIDVGAARRTGNADAGRMAETAVGIGPRIVFTPDARLRFSLPLAVGLTVQRLDADNVERATLLTAEAGLALSVRAAGPLYVTGEARAVLRRSLATDTTDVDPVVNVGLTLLF